MLIYKRSKKIKMSPEQVKPQDSEVLKPPQAFDVILVRHAAYQTEGEGVAKEAVGGLTPEGTAQSKELGRQVFQRVAKTGKPTDVLFISSSTAYEDKTGELYARRAEQTADAAMAQILELSQSFATDQVRLLGPVPKEKPKNPYHERLVEPNIHYIPTADNPRAYFEKQVEKFGMRPDETTGAVGRKEGYARGDAEVDAVAQEIGAETALEAGTRAYDVVKDMKHLADVHAEVYPGRDFLVVLVTHDDVMRSVAQNLMGAGEEAHGYFPANAEILPLHIESDKAQLEFKGKVYNKYI
jgi:broad specificity phosphatase PhoE